MQYRKTMELSFDIELISKLDKKRGLVSRSRFIEEILKEYFN